MTTRHPSMKKLAFQELGHPVLIDIDTPKCDSKTALLRTRYSGLSNGTERNQLLGMNYNAGKSFPFLSAGYQTVSEVIEVGSDISKFKVGDLVATGTFGTHSQYHLLQESDLATKLPNDFDQISGALLSVASVAYRNVYRAAVSPGETVLICGAGPIGLFAMQIAKALGATALVLTRGEKGARLAESLGADAVGFGNSEAQNAFLDSIKPVNVVVETTGSADIVNKTLGQGWADGIFGRRSRGRLVVTAGYGQVAYSGNAAQASEIALLHSGHFDLEDHQAVIALVSSGKLQIRPVVSDVVPASDIVSVYEKLRDEPSNLSGTVFDWTGI